VNLYEGDPIQALWEQPVWAVWVSVFAAGFLMLCIFNLMDLGYYETCSRPRRHGITRFRTVMIGDSLNLPTLALLVALFYREAGETRGWYTNGWVTWSAVAGSLMFTTHWLRSAIADSNGDWTTIPGEGINLWGWYHAIFFWSQSYILGSFFLKGIALMAYQGAQADQIFLMAGVFGGVVFHQFLAHRDSLLFPFWYKPSRDTLRVCPILPIEDYLKSEGAS